MSGSVTTVLRRNLSRAIRERRFEDAHHVLAELRQVDPISVQTRCLELELLFESGCSDDALALAPQVVGMFPESAKAHFLAGRVEARRRGWAAALERFEESDKLAPHWRSRWWIGKSLTQLGEFERAEPLLAGLVAEHPCCGCDLSWLYERSGELRRALAAIESYIDEFPDNEYARSKRKQLEARLMDPAELVEELDGLRELGEEVAAELVPAYVESLLTQAKGAEARAFIEDRKDRLPPRLVTQTAWKCYRLKMFDLALTLFLKCFDHNADNAKFMTSVEKAADMSGRVDALIEFYGSKAKDRPKLWGRIKRLQRRQELGR